MVCVIYLCVCVCSPFHTVYISLPAVVCEPSDVSVHSVIKEAKIFLSHTRLRFPSNMFIVIPAFSHSHSHKHTHVSEASRSSLSEGWLTSEVNLKRKDKRVHMFACSHFKPKCGSTEFNRNNSVRDLIFRNNCQA